MRLLNTFTLFLLFTLSLAQAASVNAPQEPSFTITVEEPAFVGEPIWVRASQLPKGIRFLNNGGMCNRLELLYESKPADRWAFNSGDPRGDAVWRADGSDPAYRGLRLFDS